MSLAESVSILDMPAPRREPGRADYGAEASLNFERRLEQKIRDFWAETGYTTIEFKLAFDTAGSGRYDLRSNMKNALPIDWKKP